LDAFDVVVAFDDFQLDAQFVVGPVVEAGVDAVGVPAVDPDLGCRAFSGQSINDRLGR
jgi:hypothetical protein